MALDAQVVSAFKQRYGRPPTFVVQAPGRVNLIGEHTDYNAGFVMPMAIDRGVWIALRPASNSVVTLHSLDFEETDSFSLEDLTPRRGSWSDYVRGVAWALQQHGYRTAGWEGVMAGDVPVGAGLSSSAALELAVARAFSGAAGWPWDARRMALLSQYAENRWVGVNCGIMDQMISAAASAGHALLIDCRSLDLWPVPLPSGTVVAVLDTGTRRGLVDSAYNERRSQCEAAARFFGVSALRDVTVEQLEKHRSEIEDLIYRRARHVIAENLRVLAARDAMLSNEACRLGELLDASHASLQHDFEVSSPALDAIVASAHEHPACLGARMTGAGFGGCAIALVRTAAAANFTRVTSASYAARTGLQPQIYICYPSEGATIVT